MIEATVPQFIIHNVINTAMNRGGSDQAEVLNGFNRLLTPAKETVTVAEVARAGWHRDESRC